MLSVETVLLETNAEEIHPSDHSGICLQRRLCATSLKGIDSGATRQVVAIQKNRLQERPSHNDRNASMLPGPSDRVRERFF